MQQSTHFLLANFKVFWFLHIDFIFVIAASIISHTEEKV